MTEQNMSDCIEEYLKSIMQDENQIEIKRSDIAAHFDVVPSQINYVIKTRFSLQNGYLVESKRGGSGYIRIAKVAVGPDAQYCETLLQDLPDAMTVNQTNDVLDSLNQAGVLTQHECCLLQTLLSKETLAVLPTKNGQEQLRARLLKQLLNRLRFESERES
ncbi:transcriptional regulator CtsR [Weissella uvarum]|uniref:CtsR family transcriptional regulator n=1 Tax=Weissella uvarum TaxID=1479233 RepID=UPI0019607692|nr:CtsR family transcriptional regulator [Weissella uvarum]MBM7616814.1 transcriptional regulator CtsR [Weissella uvarum]MCM0594734.1 CtsR family transcriptional regulator [Weissella uvarum]